MPMQVVKGQWNTPKVTWMTHVIFIVIWAKSLQIAKLKCFYLSQCFQFAHNTNSSPKRSCSSLTVDPVWSKCFKFTSVVDWPLCLQGYFWKALKYSLSLGPASHVSVLELLKSIVRHPNTARWFESLLQLEVVNKPVNNERWFFSRINLFVTEITTFLSMLLGVTTFKIAFPPTDWCRGGRLLL